MSGLKVEASNDDSSQISNIIEVKSNLPKIDPVKVAVIGGGAFGTALACIAARNGHQVIIQCRDQHQADMINQERVNPKVGPEYVIEENIGATTDFAEAVDGAAFIIVALPAQNTPEYLAERKEYIQPHIPLCITGKGLYVKTTQLLGEAILGAMGRHQELAFLSGPSFAIEMMRNMPTAVVVAADNIESAKSIQVLLSSLYFRVYTSTDTIGVQLGGALKNPLAIGAGMIEGSGLGINTMAAYVTRSCSELQRLCVAMGGKEETIGGLAGIGDLMLTAFGSLSRNRTLGSMVVKGHKVEDLVKEKTVEGVPTAGVAVHFADVYHLELPIFRTVAAILRGELDAKSAHIVLMGRPLRDETVR